MAAGQAQTNYHGTITTANTAETVQLTGGPFDYIEVLVDSGTRAFVTVAYTAASVVNATVKGDGAEKVPAGTAIKMPVVKRQASYWVSIVSEATPDYSVSGRTS